MAMSDNLNAIIVDDKVFEGIHNVGVEIIKSYDLTKRGIFELLKNRTRSYNKNGINRAYKEH